MNVLVIGGSRHIGYISAKRLLDKGATVTFLLRNPSCFDNDEALQGKVKEGKAKLVQGDALNEDDIRRVLNVSSESNNLDTILFTVGGSPQFSFRKGLHLSVPDICTRSMLNLLAALKFYTESRSTHPRLIIVSSTGVGATGLAAVPFLLILLYKYILAWPLADKMGLERVAGRAADFPWPGQDGEPDAAILLSGWEDRAGPKGWLRNNVTIIKPAVLTDGACTAEGKADAYRIATEEELKSAYTISRQDIAHCVVEKVIMDWSQWGGKILRVAY